MGAIYSFYPYLWTKEGADIEKCRRKLVPTEEVFKSNMENRKELKTESVTEPQ